MRPLHPILYVFPRYPYPFLFFLVHKRPKKPEYFIKCEIHPSHYFYHSITFKFLLLQLKCKKCYEKRSFSKAWKKVILVNSSIIIIVKYHKKLMDLQVTSLSQSDYNKSVKNFNDRNTGEKKCLLNINYLILTPIEDSRLDEIS